MRREVITFGLVAAFAAGCAGYAYAQHQHGVSKKPPKPAGEESGEPMSRSPRPLCPVLGEPIDFSVKTTTDEGPVYFCCPNCIPKLEKDPAKYAERVAAQRETLKKMDRVQVACPVTGKPIDGKTAVTSNGQSIGFCCKDCPAKYEQNPAKYNGALEAGYTYQTHCPVSGEKIDPTAFVDLETGQRIYLCCKGCGEKLTKDPAKYAPKLEDQGIKLDLKKLTAQPANKDDQGQHGGHDHPCCR
jgi:YHS domain-containing protein